LTFLAFWVILSHFMWAADYAIRHYNRFRALILNELKNLPHDEVIVSDVTFL